jgi:hypothetical protein
VCKVCKEQPIKLLGAPIGMYHCPVTGIMVLAGVKCVYDGKEGNTVCECTECWISGEKREPGVCQFCYPGKEGKAECCYG